MQRRIPELDGVRGIAILLVFVAHLLDGVWPHDRRLLDFVPHGGGGGFIGVQLFFVLSGYLITSILVAEITRTGRVDFKAFYLRRTRRLLPALVSVCACYAAYALLVLTPADRTAAFGAIARALTYTTNLHYLWGAVPDSQWLTHCWSLAVEEQFYLLWPPVLLLLARRKLSHAAVGAVATMVLTAALRMVPKLGPISYEVLRWDALMCGAYMAIAKPRIPPPLRWAGALCMAYFAVHVPAGGHSTWDYLISAIGGALFIDLALHSKLTTSPILLFFGKISYALYLWHVVLMRFGISGWVAGPLSVAVSELSYRYVEARFLRPPSAARSAAQSA